MSGLQSEWRYYQLSSSSEQAQRSWADSLKMVGQVVTIPELLYTLDETEKRGLESLSDLNFFRAPVLPMWEDAANVNGGRCIMEVPTSQRDAIFGLWKSTVALCASGMFETVCGCVFSEKANYRISIWVSDQRECENLLRVWRDVLHNTHSMFSFVLHNKYADSSKSKKKNFTRNK